MFENFASYTKNKGGDCNEVLKELEEIKHFKQQGRPKFSSVMIRFSLTYFYRYTSCQAYELFLELLTLPLLNLLKRRTSRTVDSKKIAKLLPKQNIMSSNCVLFVEIYLQQSVQYNSANFVVPDEEGIFIKRSWIL